jgi:N-acetylglucosaminyl-diphospho-decaprenol L-rhamnosyltransferase
MTADGPAAAVVVNYNAGDHLIDCVRSLRAAGVDRIVVVDNASVDGSPGVLRAADPGVEVVDAGGNLGFGRGVNRGAARVDAPLLLVLNPDTVIEPGSVKALATALDADPSLGIVGPRIEEPDGTLYPSARSFPAMRDAIGHAFLGPVMPRNRFTRRYRMLDADRTVATRVDWVSGACMLVRRPCFDQLGGFDEDYFMYGEDVDLCWRAWKAGWAVGYEPSGRVVHVQGVSTDRHPYRMIAAHHRSLLRFWWRSTPPVHRVALAPFVAGGLAVRLILAWIQRGLDGVRAK